MDWRLDIASLTTTPAPRYGGRAASLLTAVTLICALPLAGRAQQPTGTIRIKTDVPQVQVILDGKDVGATPLTLTDVAAGTHALTLKKPGWTDHIDNVVLERGKTASMFIVMKRPETPMPALPVQFRTVHAHGTGRCVGTLVVQRDSILFKADDGRDVFAIPMRSVQMVSRGSGVNVGSLVGSIAAGLATGLTTGVATTTIETASAGSGSLVPLQLDTTGRNYTFLAFESGDNPAAVPSNDRPAATVAVSNQVLFELVQRVYMEDLKAR